MIDLAAAASRMAHIYSEWGQNGCLPRIAAVCAVVAAVAVFIGGVWHAPAYADGGASARGQAAAPAPADSGATPQAYAQQILRALADDYANNWARHWQARADCDAVAAQDAFDAPLDRVLLTLTAAICASLDARLGVNPADYSPRGEDRSVGLLLSEPGMAAGYTLFTGYDHRDVFLIDPLGRVAHAWHLDTSFTHAKLLDNGNLLAGEENAIFEFDPRGNMIWQYSAEGRIHHDFLKMPNGNVMMIVEGRKTREDAIAAGSNPEFVRKDGKEYDYLIEVRPTGAHGGEVMWEWSVWDHLVQDFDPSKENYGAVAEHPELIDINFPMKYIQIRLRDWTHANAIDYNPALDQIMLSPRHFSELWIIDHSATTAEARGHSGGNSGMGGDLLYRWGNPRAYGRGDAGDQRLFWQHQAHWIPPGLPGAGNILLFNNGNEFSDYRRYYSSIDEIVPPVDGYRYRRAPNSPYPPDALAWTYAAETRSDFYAPVRSGAQRLPNGNTLIVDGTAGTISQAAPNGRIVWKYVAPLNARLHLRQGERAPAKRVYATPYGGTARLANSVYRAYWYPPDYPGLQALDLTPGAFIEDFPDIYDISPAIVAAVASGDFGAPLADSDFDIYLDEDAAENKRRLIYIKRPCAAAAQPNFFLHIYPADARDLPAARHEHGFNNKDFGFGDRGKTSDDWCIAVASLPDYPIERIRTGQFTDEGTVWRAEIELGE